ncbi:MAG: diguanylate cyclase, partial [Acidobacteriota bacterium]|nr:diguanylate cyclase [Acidobacteriota bacterium]
MSATHALRLLIVEDDLPSARSLREMLEHSDDPQFTIRHVASAAAACEAVRHGDLDVVMLDLGLPDATDLQALVQLEAAVHEIPVIVLTGRGDESLATDALHFGAEDYLRKGEIAFDSLIRSIRYAVERHRGVRDLARVKKELESANRDLERLTLIDPLTELLNRRGLQQALSREVQHLTRGVSASAALVIDLDDFKQINDSLGHAAGDVVLKEVARRLRASVRGIDFAGRVGGDEFMLILPETSLKQAMRCAERIQSALTKERFRCENSASLPIGFSYGIAVYPEDTQDAGQLVSIADRN